MRRTFANPSEVARHLLLELYRPRVSAPGHVISVSRVSPLFGCIHVVYTLRLGMVANLLLLRSAFTGVEGKHEQRYEAATKERKKQEERTNFGNS